MISASTCWFTGEAVVGLMTWGWCQEGVTGGQSGGGIIMSMANIEGCDGQRGLGCNRAEVKSWVSRPIGEKQCVLGTDSQRDVGEEIWRSPSESTVDYLNLTSLKSSNSKWISPHEEGWLEWTGRGQWREGKKLTSNCIHVVCQVWKYLWRKWYNYLKIGQFQKM